MKFKRLRFQSNGATNYTLARKQLVGAFRDTHTNTNTHYTASSSIQAPFGCPANPALVVHALERLRLCCSILLHHDAGQHNTRQQKHFTLLCPGRCGRKTKPQKKPPRPYNTIKSKRLRFKSNGATNYTLARKQPRSAHRTPSISIPRRMQRRSAHRTPSISISLRIHRAPRRCAGPFAPLLFDPAVWSAVSACGGDCGIHSLAGFCGSSCPPRAVGVCYEPLRLF